MGPVTMGMGLVLEYVPRLDRWLRSVIDPYYWEPTWTSQQADLVQVASALR